MWKKLKIMLKIFCDTNVPWRRFVLEYKGIIPSHRNEYLVQMIFLTETAILIYCLY